MVANKFTQDNPTLVSKGETYNTYALGKSDLSSKLRNVKTKNDLVSALGSDGVTSLSSSLTDYIQTPLASHSLDNFLKSGGRVKREMSLNDLYK